MILTPRRQDENLKIAYTPGEPAGIGPDLIIQLAQSKLPNNFIVIADENLLHTRAAQLKLPLPSSLQIHHVPAANIDVCGKPDKQNAAYVLETIKIAAEGCENNKFNAMVTGPVHKGIINEAGIPFSGHTEYLAKLAKIEKTVMLLQTEGLRVALATTHLPLAKVPAAITQENLSTTLKILHHALKTRFKINNPTIYVCGLNPHAGENGHLGGEEIDVIIPALKQCQQQGMDLMGPLPADTIFTEKYLCKADCILAMYHDQGLPVLKYKGFGKAANITLGLPFIRTSVDHGTALDLAGTGLADSQSLSYAIDIAQNLL